MTLRKRYIRNIKKNLSFYICAVLLTGFSVMLYLGFDAATVKLLDDLNVFYRDYHIEDAQFTTMSEISDEDISKLEDKYDITIERQTFIDFEEKDYTVRVMKRMDKVNLYKMSGGSDVERDDEIILNTGLMTENGLGYGDKVKLGENEYTLVGDFERPDYLFPIKEATDTFAIKSEFGIAEVSDKTYEKLIEDKGITQEYYSIIYHNDNIEEVKKYINEEYTMLSYMRADSNTRISTPLTECEETVNMMNSVVIIFVIFIAIIISVVIGRKIKADRRQIGVLIALGYKKQVLSRHYSFYGLFPAVIGFILGFAATKIFGKVLISQLFRKIESVPMVYSIKPVDAVISIAVPVVLYTLAVYFSAAKVMKTDVITMISGRSTGKNGRKLRMKKSHLSVKSRYRLRQIFGKPGRSIIVIIGLAFGGMLYSFCVTCIDSMDSYVNNTVDQIGSFEYEYFLKVPETGKPDTGSAILGSTFEVKDRDDMIMLLGIDDTEYINFSDEDGNELEYNENHYYITTMASLAFGVEAGDEISFINPITLDDYTVKISDVIENDSQSAIYCSRKNAAELLDMPEDLYNIIMSEEAIDIDEEKLAKTVTKQSLADQIDEVKKGMQDIVGILEIFAIAICVIVVYMMVSVLIAESESSVSMLKVLGYRNKEINGMVINVYHFLIPIAIILSIILGFYGTKAVFDANVSMYKTYLETLIYPVSVIKIIMLIVVSYVISLLLLRGKVGKVNLVESLKDNRE
ncbi:MAG: ABC transporter permease [Eubacterium sp.]|nr:ABC transporter permease [Eubacterium sp.]